MNRKFFVNMPVADVSRSIAFFKGLGFTFNPQFTSADAGCMIIGPETFVMFLSHAHFKKFAPKPMTDTSKNNEALFCVSVGSRSEVDETVKKAVAAGATTFEEPTDHGGMMYDHSFIDLDGHGWSVMWFDPNFVQPAPAE